MMRKEGLDPNKQTMESIEPSARIAMLATHKISAIDFFIITKPAMERAVKDAKVVTFLFADHGLDLYSNGIGVTEKFIKENPDVVKGAAEIIQKYAKALKNDITVERTQDRRGSDGDAGRQEKRPRDLHRGAC
jgi:NitT/TauT family transport system substrate-binding protein